MRIIYSTLYFTVFITTCSAQYFQFTQYNFAQQRVNPATVASSDYASLSFNYRNQATGGGFHLNSNMVSAAYPLMNRRAQRWAGIGISLMDDRSGLAGIFNTQEMALSYAISIPLAKWQTISLGMKGLYQTRKINLDGLFTGSQYIADRGFDESISNGENLSELRNNFFTFSVGLYWQQCDKKGNRLAYWGVSFFDFNKPEDSFLESTSQLNSTFVGMFGLRLYTRDRMSVFPEILFTRNGGNNVVNAGIVTSYEINTYRDAPSDRIDIITKYVPDRSGIVGVQLHRENFSIGFSYDFPMIKNNVANTSTVELGIEVRRLVDPKKKNKRRRQNARNERSKISKNVAEVKRIQTLPLKDSAQTKNSGKGKEDLSTRLRHKQDSIHAHANAGQVRHEPLILEKATLHFNFQFNSVELDEDAVIYLNDLAKALIDNPELKIKLVGHTDNVGSDKFNLKLSIYRSESIKAYLIERGIKENRITAEGKGMREPLNGNKTDEDRALNRRVEMTILYDE